VIVGKISVLLFLVDFRIPAGFLSIFRKLRESTRHREGSSLTFFNNWKRFFLTRDNTSVFFLVVFLTQNFSTNEEVPGKIIRGALSGLQYSHDLN
jgi:hypothetical protein